MPSPTPPAMRRRQADASVAAASSIFRRKGQLKGARRQRTEEAVAGQRCADEGQDILVEQIVDIDPRLHALQRADGEAVADIDIGAENGETRHTGTRRIFEGRSEEHKSELQSLKRM